MPAHQGNPHPDSGVVLMADRLDCKQVFDFFTQNGVEFYTGVPDSLLKDICAYISDYATQHHITPNEGHAVALATGYHLATGKTPLVYMQNSGLGNTVNPLTSIADPEVYAIPMLLVIGWRGEPGVKDEPQHVKMGRINPAMLDALEIPYEILPANFTQAQEVIRKALAYTKEKSAPFALLVRANTFDKYKLTGNIPKVKNGLSRENAIRLMLDRIPATAIVVGTTGKIAREIYEYRDVSNRTHARDFYTVGAMGHSAQIALGIAQQKPDKEIYCFDGDGAVLMQMGSLATLGTSGTRNFRHIVFNNYAHESVGGQPTVANRIDIPAIARACGYNETFKAETPQQLEAYLDAFLAADGPVMLEILVEAGSRDDLVRPRTTPVENKRALMETLRHDD